MGDSVDGKLIPLGPNKNNDLKTLIESTDENEFIYKSNYENKGMVIIFNHYKYDDPRISKRNGTELDVKSLQGTFSKLGFNVTIYNDLKFLEIETALEKVSRMDHSGNACLVVVAMSHGEDGNIINARDHEYETQELWKYFVGDRCPTLVGKPKLFFIQACKGGKVDHGVLIETDSAPNKEKIVIPEMADILVMYSTYPGYFSWRSQSNGSWFVQSLCKVLDEKKFKGKDLLTLLTFVQNRMAINFQSNVPQVKGMHKKKQIGTIVSTLTKILYLTNPDNPEKNA